MWRWIAIGVVGILATSTACRGRPVVNEERGAGHAPIQVEGPARARPAKAARIEAAPIVGGTGGAILDAPTAEEDEEEPPLELDLALRVRNAYGYPAECLGPNAVDEGVTRFSIRLSVSMTSTGMVTRSSVSAPVSAESQACLEARAASLRVAGPIPDAPRTVTTAIEVEAVARVAAAEPPEMPEYELPPGAQAPGRVLPAVVGDGPAPGYRPPGRTLPAIAGDGPAPGSRPAASALPARGSADSRDWRWISGSAEARGDVADNLDDPD